MIREGKIRPWLFFYMNKKKIFCVVLADNCYVNLNKNPQKGHKILSDLDVENNE